MGREEDSISGIFFIFWWSVSYRHEGSAPFFFSMKKSSSRHADILFNMESTRAFFPSSFLSHSSSPPFLLFLPLMPRPNRIECRGNRTEEDVVCHRESRSPHTLGANGNKTHTHPLFPYTHSSLLLRVSFVFVALATTSRRWTCNMERDSWPNARIGPMTSNLYPGYGRLGLDIMNFNKQLGFVCCPSEF